VIEYFSGIEYFSATEKENQRIKVLAAEGIATLNPGVSSTQTGLRAGFFNRRNEK
jgi:hypothetical protein